MTGAAAAAVRLNTGAAEAAVAFLRRDWGRMAAEALAARWAEVVGAPAYAAWARGCSSRPDEVLAALRRPPSGPAAGVPEGVPWSAQGVFAAFAEGRRREDERSARLAQARRLPVAAAAERAQVLLPSGTALEAAVFVLLSGDRQGLAGERGEVTLDLLAVPSISASALMTPLLAHLRRGMVGGIRFVRVGAGRQPLVQSGLLHPDLCALA